VTQQEIIKAVNQLPLVERKALLQELVLSMWKEIEDTNPSDKLERQIELQSIAEKHGFPSLISKASG
jgi:hypothetical protein